MLRAFLCAEARAALREAGAGEVDVQGEAARDIDAHLARVWPRLTPQAFLVELLSSRRQLLAAAAGTLTEDEMAMLALPSGTQVSSHQWSVDDYRSSSTADACSTACGPPTGTSSSFQAGPVAVQLESVRRRSLSSMTVLGDSPRGRAVGPPLVGRDRAGAAARAGGCHGRGAGLQLPAAGRGPRVAVRLLPAVARPRPAAGCGSGHGWR